MWEITFRIPQTNRLSYLDKDDENDDVYRPDVTYIPIRAGVASSKRKNTSEIIFARDLHTSQGPIMDVRGQCH